MRIYLAGPINGCMDDEANGWRTVARTALTAAGHDVVDPMARDYRGRELENVDDIVHGDKRDINSCDTVLVMAARPSFGTAMEVLYAWEQGKDVIAVATHPASPWLAYHSRVVETLTGALDAVLS